MANPHRMFGLLVVLLGVSCSSSSTLGPANQVQVTNVADNFQFQASALNNVTQTLSYDWSNTGDSTSINQASTVSAGTATLTVSDPANTVRYSAGLQNNGTFHSAKGTVGTWHIQVVLANVSGTLNFRVQKAP